MTDFYCENCECFEDRSTNKIVDGYCRRYNQSLIFYDWFEKCDKCIEEEKMTEQEIERCLKRLATCKTTDVMNFDYAGTLAYIKRLKSENVALRNEADENAALSMENKMRADRLEEENAALRERLEKAVKDVAERIENALFCEFADDMTFKMARRIEEVIKAELKGGKER